MARGRLPDRGWMPLKVSTRFTEAEAVALSELAKLLAGGSVRQPLITALNKVRGDLAHARLVYATKPTGRVIPGLSERDPEQPPGDPASAAPRRRGRPPGSGNRAPAETPAR